jgi:hypothetical protein
MICSLWNLAPRATDESEEMNPESERKNSIDLAAALLAKPRGVIGYQAVSQLSRERVSGQCGSGKRFGRDQSPRCVEADGCIGGNGGARGMHKAAD